MTRRELVPTSFIGASRILDHWQVPDQHNSIKGALAAGRADMLMLGGRLTPDEGIDRFVTLGLAHNPGLRITVQDIWLPFDRLDRFPDGIEAYGDVAATLHDWKDPTVASPDPQALRQDTSLYDAPTPQQLARLHAVYLERMDESLAALNRKIGRQVVFVVPVGQAEVALRTMVATGKVAEIPKQAHLFADRLGHPKEVIWALSAYCHFAVIYRKSPEELPMLPSLKQHGDSEEVNRILQRLSWDAGTQHVSSGVSVGH